MAYVASKARYDAMKYNKCGESGLKLPAVSLGLWHNFGANDDFENMRQMCFTAFDSGITHFDIANNYGNPANGDVLVTDVVQGIQFTEEPKELKQGDKFMEITLPFIALRVTKK